jgi:hypothetical protein
VTQNWESLAKDKFYGAVYSWWGLAFVYWNKVDQESIYGNQNAGQKQADICPTNWRLSWRMISS